MQSSLSCIKGTSVRSIIKLLRCLSCLMLCSTASASTVHSAVIYSDSYRQVIDGFGAADAFWSESMSSADQDFYFGTGPGQLGLSILRVLVPDGSSTYGNCSKVSINCAGPDVGDMKAIIAHGGMVYASPWTPPARYKTNGKTSCENNSGLKSQDYQAYALWLRNFVMSLKEKFDISLKALSVQNEPDACAGYDSAIWSGAEIDAFVKTNLGPTFRSAGINTLIFVPETGSYHDTSLGNECAQDASCNRYVGGINWHDYDSYVSEKNLVAADPFPPVWPQGKDIGKRKRRALTQPTFLISVDLAFTPI
jgi:glucuronoarabinoxylan endo-1,4-beta-xylanase